MKISSAVLTFALAIASVDARGKNTAVAKSGKGKNAVVEEEPTVRTHG